jgi:hypothetical protein
MILLPANTVSAQTENILDRVNASVVTTRIIDCCGDYLNFTDQAKKRQPNGFIPIFPPNASECCAYENSSWSVTPKPDQLEIVYDAIPDLFAEGFRAFMEIREKTTNNLIFEQELPFGKNKLAIWNLKNQDGSSLSVGKEGREYIVQTLIKKDGAIIKKSGILPILVDDCDLRDELIPALKTNPDVFDDPAFHKYLDLLYAVSRGICTTIRRGAVLYLAGETEYKDRCHVMCINNSFLKEIIDHAGDTPSRTGHIVAHAHYKIKVERLAASILPEPTKSVNESNFVLVQTYALMENILRAEGLYKCGAKAFAKFRVSDLRVLKNIITSNIKQQFFNTPEFLSGISIDFYMQLTYKVLDDLQNGERSIGDNSFY